MAGAQEKAHEQLVVEIADDDMRVLEKVARHQARDPAELLREQVNIFVTAERIGNTGGKLKAAKPVTSATSRRKARRLLALAEQRDATVSAGKTAVEPISNMFPDESRPEAAAQQDPDAPDDQHAARERRLKILRRTSGLMKNVHDFPKDGLQYQTEVRAEWD